jgi:hypothetical protein
MLMPRRILLGALLAGALVALAPLTACSSAPALDKAVQIAESTSGYVDLGIVNGQTKLVPYASIRVKNVSDQPLTGFQLSASFWRTGEDGQKDELQLQGLVAKGLAPGAISDPIIIRANFGYSLAGARADFFKHSLFVDFTIKVLGKTAGRIYKIGEVKVDRTIIAKDALGPTT